MHSFPAGAQLLGGRNSAPVHRQLAREFYRDILPIVAELRAKGLSLRAIARELDGRGIKTRYHSSDRGWSATQIRRLLARLDAEPEAVPVQP